MTIVHHSLSRFKVPFFRAVPKKEIIAHLFYDVVFRNWNVEYIRFPLRRAFNRHGVPFREHFNG